MRVAWEVFDPAGVPVGPVEGITQTRTVTRVTGVGVTTGTAVRAYCDPLVTAVIEAGGAILQGVVVDLYGVQPILFRGRVEAPQSVWGEGEGALGGTFSWTASDDTAVLGHRRIYTTPGSAWSAQTLPSRRWPSTGTAPAGSVIRSIVDEQVGPGALTARRAEVLTLATEGTPVGAATAVAANLGDNVADVIGSVAAAAGLVYRVEPAADDLLSRVFRVWVPQVLPDVLLSVEAETLRGGRRTVTGPAVTRVLAAGDTARVEVADTTAEALWGRREGFTDKRGTNDTATIGQEAAQALVEDGTRGALTVVAQETDDVRVFRDLNLGDRVPYLAPLLGGWAVTDDVLREVSVEQRGTTTTVGLTLGTADAGETPGQWRRIHRLEARLGRLRARP